MRPSILLHGVWIACALAATSCVVQAQPAGEPPAVASAAHVPGEETDRDAGMRTPAAAGLEDYAGIYEFSE